MARTSVVALVLLLAFAAPAQSQQAGIIVNGREVARQPQTGIMLLEPTVVAPTRGIFTCPACLSAATVDQVFDRPVRVYGAPGYIMQTGAALGNLDVVVGIKAMPQSIGIFNATDKTLEFTVTSLGLFANTYTLGASEIVTVPCNDCRTELTVSIETAGQPTYAANFAGGTIVLPVSNNGRWELAPLGAGE